MQLPAFLARHRRLWIGLAIALLLYTLFGFLAVPRLVASMAADTVAGQYGRQLTIGAVRFNPFTLRLEVDDLALPDADGGPLFAFRQLIVNLQTSSLWRRALTFREISLTEPRVQAVIRPGGALNLGDLAPPDETAATPTEPEPLPRLLIHRLQIEGGGVRFEDRDRSKPFVADIAPISFTLTDFSTHTETGNLYQFDARIFEQAALAWRGTLQAQPLASDGQLGVTGLPLPQLAAYAGESLPVEISRGQASVRGTYRFAAGEETTIFQLENGELGLESLGLRRPGDAADYAELPSVTLSGVRADLGAQTADVARVEVTGGAAEGWLGPDGTPVLAALAAGAEARAEEVAEASPAPSEQAAAAGESEPVPWIVSVPVVAVTGFRLALEDRQVSPSAAFTLDPVNVTVNGFSTRPGTAVDLTADLGINGPAKLATAMTINLDTLVSEGTVELSGFDLTALQPYVAGTARLIVKSGTADVKGTVTYADAEPAGDIRFTGDVTVANLRTVDDVLQEDFVKWSRLEVRGVDYRSKPERLRIDNVALRAPYARVLIGPDQTTNISTILGETAATEEAAATDAKIPAAAPAAAGPTMPIRTGRVRIVDGSMNFADLSLQPGFRTGIEKLKGSIAGLSSDPAARATVELDGQVGQFSPVTIRGRVNPLAAETFLDMAITFRNLEMASFTPYSGRFAGYSIRQGKLSLDLNYNVQDRQLNAKHNIIIDQLELGDKVESEDSVSLPLELAVALLKDKNGVIDLDLPVTGDLDDPQFRVGPIIWKALVNLLTKAVTAPFALLGSLFGGGEDVNLIDFAPGEAALSEAEAGKLANLVTALTERPGLQLSVPAAYTAGTDSPALIERGLQQQVVAAKRAATKSATDGLTFDAVAADREDYLRQLRTAFRQVAGRDAEMPEPPDGDDDSSEAAIALLEDALRQRIAVTEADLFELARQRAVAVQEKLLTGTGIDPARVFLTSPAEAKSEGGVVVMELTLR